MNRVLCPLCFEMAGKPAEKTCVHGIWGAKCVGCGKKRNMGEKPYWHCLGSAPEKDDVRTKAA